MRMSLPLLLVLLSPFFSATIHAKAGPPSSAPRKAKIDSGWATVQDLKDPHILEIAKFAVSEYNQRNKTNLTLSQLVAAQKQVVDGTKYVPAKAAGEGKQRRLAGDMRSGGVGEAMAERLQGARFLRSAG
ncbi:hypothetical protein Cni_G26266 [Canna indica]|uniref:Cystatin domain-containing protein n=1 Tax=Canna indica TaxID=4628 RepID=A0AAQ3QN79_9LILI|nr:hypothetical protein Cni_G26266 [Canna indica]